MGLMAGKPMAPASGVWNQAAPVLVLVVLGHGLSGVVGIYELGLSKVLA